FGLHAGLFCHFTHYRGLDRLVRFDETARDLPVTAPIATGAPDEQQPPFVHNRATHSDIIPGVVPCRQWHCVPFFQAELLAQPSSLSPILPARDSRFGRDFS